MRQWCILASEGTDGCGTKTTVGSVNNFEVCAVEWRNRLG